MTSPVSQILLLDQPRSGSKVPSSHRRSTLITKPGHLQARILNSQSNVTFLDHPFSQARGVQMQWLLRDDFQEGMPASVQSEFDAAISEGITKWQVALEKTQEAKKIVMIQDHIFNAVSPEKLREIIKLVSDQSTDHSISENITLIPETLLLRPGTVPMLNIRNPRLVVPSAYRVLQTMDIPHAGGRTNFIEVTSHIWSRLIYEFYVAHGIKPLIVDADDLMTSENFIRHLCVESGLDPAQANLKWEVPTADEREKIHPIYYKSQSTLVESSGLKPELAARNRDLEAEEGKWEEEFGGDVELMREMVRLAMPHYEYLYKRRLRLPEP